MSGAPIIPEIRQQFIGSLDVEGGRDDYVLLTRLDDELTADEAREHVMRRNFIEGSDRPGSWFCHTATVMTQSANKAVCVVHYRQNV